MKSKKHWSMIFFLFAVLVVTLFSGTRSVEAASKKVMRITVQNKYTTKKTAVYYDDNWDHFTVDKTDFEFLTVGTDRSVKISIEVLDKKRIQKKTLKYDKKVKFTGDSGSLTVPVTFSYDSSWYGDSEHTIDLSFREVGDADKPQVESLAVSIGSDGFHPSKNNYLRIKSYIPANRSYRSMNIRLRVYNSKGKYVFQKVYKNVSGGYLEYKWDGTASKNNQAKAKAKKYVKDGKYKVEIYAYFKYAKQEVAGKKTKTITVSSKAPSGAKGLAKAQTVPILTGYQEVDYMAEQICKSAGVKSSMSADQKVKTIYHWMTKNQKHVHYYESDKEYKSYYKLTSKATKKKIASYRKTTDKQLKKGKLIYNHNINLAYEEWYMEHRVGVCDNSAAIFKILCNHAGVEAGLCSGYYLNRNGTKAGHAWNYAIVDGKKYYYDVDVEIQNYGKGQGDYYWYKKTRSEANKTHEFLYMEE